MFSPGIPMAAGRPERAATLGNRSLEQALGQRRCAQLAHGDATGRFAHDGDFAGIAAERRDILLDPLQAGDHVEHAIVAGGMMLRLGGQTRVRHESERTDTVRDADKHHAFPGQLLAAVDRNRCCTAGKTAAVNPNQHGQTIAGRLRRGPHVQV